MSSLLILTIIILIAILIKFKYNNKLNKKFLETSNNTSDPSVKKGILSKAKTATSNGPWLRDPAQSKPPAEWTRSRNLGFHATFDHVCFANRATTASRCDYCARYGGN